MTPRLPDTFQAALQSIQDRDFLTTKRYREQQWRAKRDGAHPDILLFEQVLVRRMRNLGVPMFSNEVMRTPERQKLLFQAGRSKIETNGAHTVGGAVDVIHSLKAWDLSTKAWALVGHVGKEIAAQEGLKLTWGGDWKFYDPAHWELADWKQPAS